MNLGENEIADAIYIPLWSLDCHMTPQQKADHYLSYDIQRRDTSFPFIYFFTYRQNCVLLDTLIYFYFFFVKFIVLLLNLLFCYLQSSKKFGWFKTVASRFNKVTF